MAIDLLLISKEFFPPWLMIYHGEGLMVTPTGHSHRNNYANFGRTWLTMKNHDNMHNLLPLYYCDKGKDFTAFSLGQLVAILTFCTVRPASLFFHSSYKPFRYKLFLFQKKKTLKTPYPFEVCSCALDFMVIGHYTNNIHENFQVFTIFSV